LKTVTSKWAGYQDQIDAPRSLVLKLTDGSSTWYFSNRLMKITDGYCHPYLSSSFSTKEGFDFQTKRWITPTVSLRLTNAPMEKQDTGSYLRVSDKIANVSFNIATLYGALGGDVSALSQMMVIFEGQIVDPIDATESTVTLSITDRSRLWNIQLPNRLIGEEYATAPAESLPKVIPIAYGSYSQAADSSSSARADYTGNGLAVGVLVALPPSKAWTAGNGSLHVFADHIIKTWDSVWFEAPFGVHPMQGIDATAYLGGADPFPVLDTDNSGCATAEPGAVELYLDFVDCDSVGYDIDSHDEPANPFNAFDNNASTYSQSATEQHSYFPMRLKDSGDIRSVGIEAALSVAKLDGIINTTAASDNYYVYLFYDNTGSDVSTTGVSVTPSASAQTIDINWTSSGNLRNAETGSDILVVLLATSGTGTRALSVYEARMRIPDITMYTKPTSQGYGAFDGKAYGAWVDVSGHSTNYDEGDLIDDPVQIVQDILRTWLSLGDTNIDYASFAAAENTSVSARLNLHEDNKMKVYDIARTLAEQSTAAVYVSCQGKWRAVPLNNESPTTSRTIIWSDAAGVSVTTVGDVVNHLTVKSRWQSEYDAYRDINIVEDATSQSDYIGTYSYEANWPNICGTSKDHVAAWLVNTTDGIWSKDHNVVNLSLRGWKHFDLECGDVIELDATSCDPHLLLRGATWADHQFTIVEIGYRQNQIDIKAVELYT
jgi:hypothetical protein